jgi:cysteine-rich repeat protein
MDDTSNVTICTKSCPKGYYGNSESGYCYPCAIECGACIIEPHKCTQCNAKLKYTRSSANEFVCIPLDCKDNSFEGIINEEYKCIQCHRNCKKCSGPENYHCIDCQSSIGYIKDSSYFMTQRDTYTCLTCEEYDIRLKTPTNGKLQCEEICGDGYNMGIFQCDDGNLLSGDGCSSNCEIENGWECSGGSLISQDECIDVVPPTMLLIRSKNSSILTIKFSEVVVYTNAIENATDDFYQCAKVKVIKANQEYPISWSLISTPNFTQFKEIQLSLYINLSTTGTEVIT